MVRAIAAAVSSKLVLPDIAYPGIDPTYFGNGLILTVALTLIAIETPVTPRYE